MPKTPRFPVKVLCVNYIVSLLFTDEGRRGHLGDGGP